MRDHVGMQITIERRFCGPSTSGNGGWTSGLLAAALRSETGLAAPVTVRLSAPPPLDRPLEIVLEAASDDGDALTTPIATLMSGTTPIASATAAAAWQHEPAPFVPVDTAAATAAHYVSLEQHPFPRCFVCGPARTPGDGLRLAPGRLEPGRSACVWHPADALTGDLSEPWLWAALDCPGGWASDILARPMVLGTMTAEVLQMPAPEQTCVVTGRADRTEGRRTWTSSSLWSTDGDLLARAEAVWVEVDPAVFDTILG